MERLEKVIMIVCVVALVCVVVVVVWLDVGPEVRLRLRLWELQSCQDRCVVAHEIGTQGHRVCVETCLAEYYVGVEK